MLNYLYLVLLPSDWTYLARCIYVYAALPVFGSRPAAKPPGGNKEKKYCKALPSLGSQLGQDGVLDFVRERGQYSTFSDLLPNGKVGKLTLQDGLITRISRRWYSLSFLLFGNCYGDNLFYDTSADKLAALFPKVPVDWKVQKRKLKNGQLGIEDAQAIELTPEQFWASKLHWMFQNCKHHPAVNALLNMMIA